MTKWQKLYINSIEGFSLMELIKELVAQVRETDETCVQDERAAWKEKELMEILKEFDY
jgi:hypothetical protein